MKLNAGDLQDYTISSIDMHLLWSARPSLITSLILLYLYTILSSLYYITLIICSLLFPLINTDMFRHFSVCIDVVGLHFASRSY